MRHEVFGTLTYDEEGCYWSGRRQFPAFAPFRQTPHGKGKAPRRFEVRVDSEDAEVPSAAQVRAFQFFVEREGPTCAKVTDAIFRWYARRRKQDRRWFEDEECPELNKPDELRDLMEFQSLRVRRDQFRGTALLGFSFACKWDDEHGLGVLAHRRTVLNVGAAEVASREPDAVGSIWLKACTAREKKAATTVLKALGGLKRAPPLPPYQSLVIAIISGDRKRIQALVNKGVDIDAVPPGEIHPLFSAVGQSRVEQVRLMLELGADVKALGPALVQHANHVIGTIGFREDMRPGWARETCEDWHKRATEVLRLLREAGAG